MHVPKNVRPKKVRHQLALAAITALIGTMLEPGARAEQKPLWELGLGAGALAFSDYRGADSTHVYPVPVPYFVYRGKFLLADRNGVRERLFNQDRVELTISVTGTPPARNNAAREGMPDLRPTLEVGPSLNTHLWRSDDGHDMGKWKLDLRMPARLAVTIESSPKAIGWTFAPQLNLDVTNIGGLHGWYFGVLAGPLFANRRYDEYFYAVAPQFERPTRPAYEPSGGYAGTQMIASVSKRYPSYWVGAFLRYDTLSGASFQNSPLVKSNSYWFAGFGIAWMIGQSSRLVEAED
jgi:outer membrane scaffolding protein for murein synthesis (MipA/OmpV family)